MRSWVSRGLVSAICATALAILTALPIAAAAPWLDDQAFVNWNSPGATIPRATTADGPFQDACLRRERPATSGDEERALSANGWRLTEYWPTRREGSLTVVLATSLYDGMCRPYDYNGFVFQDGRYIGRLAPTHMVSRTDGAIDAAGPTFAANGTIEARFTRYATSDPLCCPSLGTTRVIYRVVGGVVGVMSRTAEGGSLAAAALPKTGGPGVPIESGLILGSIAVLVGATLGRMRIRRD